MSEILHVQTQFRETKKRSQPDKPCVVHARTRSNPIFQKSKNEPNLDEMGGSKKRTQISEARGWGRRRMVHDEGAETLRLSEREGVQEGCGLLAQRLVRHYQSFAFARSPLSKTSIPGEDKFRNLYRWPFVAKPAKRPPEWRPLRSKRPRSGSTNCLNRAQRAFALCARSVTLSGRKGLRCREK